MIVIDAMDLVILGVGAILLAICAVLIVIDRIALAIKKRQQKRIDEAFKEDS